MKLYNKTRCPDSILAPLLTAAGRKVGARTGGVVVKVNPGHGYRLVSGWALDCDFLKIGGRWVNTDSGYFRIVLPTVTIPAWVRRGPDSETKRAWLASRKASVDSLALAESFYKVAMHEWKHVADFQQGGLSWSHRGPGGRRMRHDCRPEELRAFDAVDDALKAGAISKAQDEILALALWLEESK